MKNKKIKKKNYNLVCFLIVVFSIVCGIITHDYILGSIVLMLGLLDCYSSSVGKISNYYFGIFYNIVTAYLYYLNGEFGLAVASIIVFVPIQIHGIISWNKKLDNNQIIYTRKFDFKTGIIVVGSCILASLLLGYCLSFIPGQNLAFLDSTAQVLFICQIILMNLRYCENWYLYFLLNLTDLTIWSINLSRDGESALLMVITEVGFIIFNIYGFYNWYIIEKENNKGVKKIFKLISERIKKGALN